MMEHYSVLLQECLEGLHIREDGIYVDATLGRGRAQRRDPEALSERASVCV